MDERITAGNTGFASGGLKCKLGALCFNSSSVFIDSFVLRNPPERKAPNVSNKCWQTNILNKTKMDDIYKK